MSFVMREFAPIHPGEILRKEFLEPLGITPYALARDAGIDKGNLSRILNGKSSITAETALRLGRYFSVSPQNWVNLQAHYDMEVARDRIEARLEKEVRPNEAIRASLREFAAEYEAFDTRKNEPDDVFDDVVRELKRRGKL